MRQWGNEAMGHSMNTRFFGVVLLALIVLGAACKSVPPAAPPVTAPPAPPPRIVPLDTKVAWLVRLEHQRVLRDAGAASESRSSAPDLEVLARDPDPAVRRRALISIGRVGDASALSAVSAALSDSEEGVRAAAAFSLGILGAPAAVPRLIAALGDTSPMVRGRVAEALGLLGDASAATPVATASSSCGPLIASVQPDDETWPMSPDVDACRLALFALVRLKQYDALARVALDPSGAPVSRWWPVAYALQRIGDARAIPALSALAATPGVHTAAFALRGLATLRDARAVEPALAIAPRASADVRVRIAAVRALGQLRSIAAVPVLLKMVNDSSTPRNLALESVEALGVIGDRRALDDMLDRLTDTWPAMRAAAFASAAKIDPDAFLLVFSGFEPDREWSVRASLAGVLATLPADRVRTAVLDLAGDPDVKVQGPALEALVKVGAPDLSQRLFAALEAPDFALRATAAELIGAGKIEGGAARLEVAYRRGQSDSTYVARGAALTALAQYGSAAAKPVLTEALRDKDWPVRTRAAELLRGLGETSALPGRPGATRQPPAFFESDALLHPPFSPHAFLETRLGTIEIELNMTDAPVTSLTFMELARAGFFNGLKVHRLVPNFVMQAGDPRGDGQGGPGYAIRDELGMLPFVRGTVGMAIDWRDTAGSQFFITLSPQPHLDGKYTVFGRVVQGFDLLDAVAQWDVIERIRIWDGVK
jgi:HEAT repeat protein/cyclophilin family peptidyl-prolyl cis-trans isomerase